MWPATPRWPAKLGRTARRALRGGGLVPAVGRAAAATAVMLAAVLVASKAEAGGLHQAEHDGLRQRRGLQRMREQCVLALGGDQVLDGVGPLDIAIGADAFDVIRPGQVSLSARPAPVDTETPARSRGLMRSMFMPPPPKVGSGQTSAAPWRRWHRSTRRAPRSSSVTGLRRRSLISPGSQVGSGARCYLLSWEAPCGVVQQLSAAA